MLVASVSSETNDLGPGPELRSYLERVEMLTTWIADHRLIESFVSSRETYIFEALLDAFACKVADSVGQFPERGSELVRSL